MNFVVVFDACVLYPAPLRDFLVRLATTHLFAARWTDRIHDEWINSLLKKRPELARELIRTRRLMNQAIQDCLVTNFEPLIETLSLPDENDRHVLAAAIRCGAQEIITFNLKDFPADVLDKFGVVAMHPDKFVEHQFDLYGGLVIHVAKQHRTALKNPPKSPRQYLDTLAAQGLVVTADRLREFENLI